MVHNLDFQVFPIHVALMLTYLQEQLQMIDGME